MATSDLWIDRLTRLFREHPAWREAARLIDRRATSTVFFRHRPGEPWHLERRGEETLLLPGAADDPDFVFRFTPGAIDRLEAVRGSAGDFAAELFTLALSDDPELRVNIRVAAGFARLLRRGYVRLLIAGGPRVRAIGAAYGVVSVRSLQKLIATLRRYDPECEDSARRASRLRGSPKRRVSGDPRDLLGSKP
jgi:hypothetical protein